MPEDNDRHQIQASRYDIPYHYIPRYENGRFTQTRSMAWGYEYLAYLYFVIDLVRNLEFDSLLDVGCGDGRFLSEVRSEFQAKRLAGIDYSDRAIGFARIMNPDVEFRSGMIQDADHFDDPFACLTLIETLEHIDPESIPDFLAGMRQYCRDDGVLVLTVPCDNVAVTPKHYQHFSPDHLRDTLAPCFSISEMHFINMHRSPSLYFIKKFLFNRFFILNNRWLLGWFFGYYRRKLLVTDASNCRRLVAVCRPC